MNLVPQPLLLLTVIHLPQTHAMRVSTRSLTTTEAKPASQMFVVPQAPMAIKVTFLPEVLTPLLRPGFHIHQDLHMLVLFLNQLHVPLLDQIIHANLTRNHGFWLERSLL